MFRFHRRLVFWNLIILLLVVLISGFNFPFSIFAVAVGFLLTMLVSYALKLRVAAPLSELFNAIQKVGDGDLQQRVPVKGDPEVAVWLRPAGMRSDRTMEVCCARLRIAEARMDNAE